MNINADMKKELSMALQNELNRQVIGSETVLLSLPGSFGEAIAATDRRVLIIRDCDSGATPGCAAYSYNLADIKGVEEISSATGGYIELQLVKPVSDKDSGRVYFPSYDVSLFKSAADAISQLVAEKSASVSKSAPGAVIAANNGLCSKCGSKVDERAVFCGNCGEQLREVCAECSGASPVGSMFCIVCGKNLAQFTPACAQCGARVQRWMSYCTECGSSQHQSCLACGSTIQPNWRHCGNCGRLLGSGEFDPRTSRAAMNRLDSFKEAQRGQEEPSETQPAPTPAVTPDEAAQHNSSGRALFEADDLAGAILEFALAVNLDPNNGSYRCNLAVAYDENDQNDLAFLEYYKALEIDPNDVTALLSLGYMYNERDEMDKAEQVWGKIIEIAPHSPEANEVRQNLSHQDEL